jgi:hypothetical protein
MSGRACKPAGSYLLAAVLSVLLSTTAFAGPHNGEGFAVPIGGTGGTPFTIDCPAHTALVGFSLLSGTALDRLAPICSVITAQHTTGAPSEQPGTGGKGGQYQKIACPINTQVGGMTVFDDKFGHVNHIQLDCNNLTDGKLAGSGAPAMKFGGQPLGAPLAVSCKIGEAGVGIFGRSGDLIDQVGMRCDNLSDVVPAH